MPTYEYECQACHHRLEEFQSFSAKPLKKCPACGKSKLKRLIGTGAGIIFKGSGFYETDYRSANYQKDAKADSPSPSNASPNSPPNSPPNSTPSPNSASPATDSTSASAATSSPASSTSVSSAKSTTGTATAK